VTGGQADVRAAKTIRLMLAALVAWTASAVAQQTAAPSLPLATVKTSPLLVSADMRAGLDLSGPWHYSLDPFRSGLAGFHGETPDRGQQRYREIDARKEMAADNRVLYEFDLANSPVTPLPSSWLTQAPELRYYQGLMWYQRNFPVPANHKGRSFLRFGAANYSTVVYLNGQPVGRHEGGFTPFAFEVSKLLRAGDNQITVGVDSQATDATVPPPVTDWENYGGVTRSIRLVSTPDTYVDSASLELTRDGKIAVAAHLDGPQGRPVRAHDLSQRRLHLTALLLELAKHRRLFDADADPRSEPHQDDTREEWQAPAPRKERVGRDEQRQ
jgi:beta-glucuronidase